MRHSCHCWWWVIKDILFIKKRTYLKNCYAYVLFDCCFIVL